MLNGGNGGGGGAEQKFPSSGDVVTFPLQDTDPEEESPSNSAASTAFRRDLSQHRDSDGLANGSGNLAGEDSDALCTCEDGEVRFMLRIYKKNRRILNPNRFLSGGQLHEDGERPDMQRLQ